MVKNSHLLVRGWVLKVTFGGGTHGDKILCAPAGVLNKQHTDLYSMSNCHHGGDFSDECPTAVLGEPLWFCSTLVDALLASELPAESRGSPVPSPSSQLKGSLKSPCCSDLTVL